VDDEREACQEKNEKADRNNIKATSCCNYSTTNTISSHHHLHTQLDADSITHTAAIAASIAAMNVVNQPFVKIHSELEDKIAHVIRQLDSFKENESKLGKEACAGRVNPNYEQESESMSKLKYLEKVQDNQVFYYLKKKIPANLTRPML
jgi:hypothetical protein